MLACVCQPADSGVFRRSPIPLGAPPLRMGTGAIPKPGRTVRLSPVITDAPGLKKGENTRTKCTKRNKRDSANKISSDKDKRSENSTLNSHCDTGDGGKTGDLEKVLFDGVVINWRGFCCIKAR